MIPSPFKPPIVFSVTSTQEETYPLHPEEEKLVSPKAIEKRRRQFMLGRAAAHKALAQILGPDRIPILKTERGEPLWPQGIVGAITHSGDTAIAAVARSGEVSGIGIDLEQADRNVSFGISRHICTSSEMEWVKQDEASTDRRLKMIFSAKESIYKALYPIEKVELGFMDADLIWDPLLKVFRGKLLKSAGKGYPSGLDFIVGCKLINRFIFSYISLPSDFMHLNLDLNSI